MSRVGADDYPHEELDESVKKNIKKLLKEKKTM